MTTQPEEERGRGGMIFREPLGLVRAYVGHRFVSEFHVHRLYGVEFGRCFIGVLRTVEWAPSKRKPPRKPLPTPTEERG